MHIYTQLFKSNQCDLMSSARGFIGPATDYYKLESAAVFEIWAKCCEQRGDIKHTLKTAQSALGCCQGNEKRRIQDYITYLRMLHKTMDGAGTEVDLEWISGPNVLHNKLPARSQKVPNIPKGRKHKKSKRKAILKYRQPTPSSFAVSYDGAGVGINESQLINQSRTTIQRTMPYISKKRNDVTIPVDPWTDEHEESVSKSLDDEEFYKANDWSSSSDVETDVESEEEEEEEEEEEDNKTWFERSQYFHSTRGEQASLVVGEGVDIVYYQSTTNNGRPPRYPTMQTAAELDNVLKNNPEKYKRCRIQLDGPHKAICKVLEPGHTHEKIEIHGRGKCGRTYNNDEVVVEILDQDMSFHGDIETTYGQVVGVLSSKFSEIEFPLLACTSNPNEVDVMHPMCNSVPKMYVWGKQSHEKYPDYKYRIDIYKLDKRKRIVFERYFDILPNQRGRYVFLVVFLSWNPSCTYPRGAVLKVLDCGNTYKSGMRVLEYRFQVPTHYSKETVKQVEQLMTSKNNREGYTDLTDHTVFTIDPPQSRDLDDALSVWTKGDNFMVGVHITDVASVVKKGSPVDVEAQKRATTFYKIGLGRHNMLPEPLSENLLSMLPGEERRVLTVNFILSSTGEDVEPPTVKKNIIKSCCKLSYEEAQMVIDKSKEVDCSQEVKAAICHLHMLAQHIRKKRMKNSRFFVSFEDDRFMQAEALSNSYEAHYLVEEFMIKTNNAIASLMMDRYRTTVPLRCQLPPCDEQLDNWIKEEGPISDLLVQLQGKTFPNDTRLAVENQTEIGNDNMELFIPLQKSIWNQMLDAARRRDVDTLRELLFCDGNHPLQSLANLHWIHILQSAEYKCSADGTERDLMHFMLELQPYTHFTSPIRRYVDLIVQRLVHAYMDGQGDSPYTVDEVHTLCTHLTEVCKRQRNFDRATRSIKQAERLVAEPVVFDAVVDDVDESQAKFCIPSLQSSVGKEIAFNRIDFCLKPVKIPKGDTQYDIDYQYEPIDNAFDIRGEWHKRIYKYPKSQDREDMDSSGQWKTTIDANLHTIQVPLGEFAELINAAFRNSDICTLVRNIEKRWNDQRHVRGDKLLKLSKGDSDICHHYRVELDFRKGQVLRLQMHAHPQQGVLTPYVQLFQVCENMNLCLSHMHDPVDTFAKYVTRSVRNQTFKTVADYRKAWLPLVEMETAVTTVGGGDTVFLHGVKVKLFQKGHDIMGMFHLDTEFCEARNLEIGGETMQRVEKWKGEDILDMCSKHGSLDYLCIRYTPPPCQGSRKSTWVGHALVKRVLKKPNDDVVVAFQLMRDNTVRPPKDLINEEFVAIVENMFKPEVDRRTENMLRCLSSEVKLARVIALNLSLPHLSDARQLITEKVGSDIPPLELQGEAFIPPNNSKQTQAIEETLKKTFSLIQGPPGTGKTNTGLKLVYLFNKINKAMHSDGKDIEQRQILFCGPSNKSVDLVAGYLLKKLAGKCPKIIRMYGKNVENKDFPVPKRESTSSRSMRALESDKTLKSVTLHHIIRENGKEFADQIVQYDVKFKKYFKDPQNVIINEADLKTYKTLISKAKQAELKMCDVILCTCAASGNQKLTKVTRIYQCIIDESAMCPEPQAMIPIIAAKPEQVVLIGDHKQLRPIVKCTQAAEMGLDQSLFERYNNQAVFLGIQYRMHPKICDFPSRQFYNNTLVTGPTNPVNAKWYIAPGSELSIWPVKTTPRAFCHVEGQEVILTVSTAEGNEQSKSNMAEVEKVVDIFLYLTKTSKVPPKTINLMTQYNAQRHAIKVKLEYLGLNEAEMPNIQTVVASQGGEWDYVVFSTVRSLPQYKIEPSPTPGWCKYNMGFITDKNQINVALTRARKGLVIIGNAMLLQCDPAWKKLISLYKEDRCYRTDREFPPQPPVPASRRRTARPLVPGTPGVLKRRI